MEDLLKDPNIVTLLMSFLILSIGMLKLIDLLIKFLIKKLSSKNNILSKEEAEMLEEMHKWVEEIYDKKSEEYEWIKELKEMHEKTNQDGIPLWYVSQSLTDMQKEIIDLLQEVSNYQSKNNFILESLITTINNTRKD